MNIKSLLLGFAAALAVVSGAQAADAIVAAEPEPAEYVKVCDAFGTGYFYIPGTETCLKIGGRVRFDVAAADSYSPLGNIDASQSEDGFNDDGWFTRSRAELYLDTATDSEYGALKTNIIARFDFDGTYNDGGHTNTKLIAANITLGGLLVGLADSQYSSFTGYAGDIINDDVISYGGFEVNQITYNFDGGNGFTAVVSLQDDRTTSSYIDANGNGVFDAGEVSYDSGSGYMPDVVAGIGYATDAFGIKLVGGYDESVEEGGIKARLDGKFGGVEAFVMAGYNTDGDFRNEFAGWDGDWAVWGGLGYQVSDTTKVNVQLAYDDGETFAAAANVKFQPVSGFLIQPEVTYTKFGDARAIGDDDDQWNGMLRIQRTF
jgi:hypothetical protein